MQLNATNMLKKILSTSLFALLMMGSSSTTWAQDKSNTTNASNSTQQTSKAQSQASAVEELSEKRIAELSQKYFKKYPTIKKLLELNSDWEYYNGNIHIPRSFRNKKNLIIEGNITVDGDYIEVIGSNLIVIGNLTTNNILSQNTIYVTGNLTINKLLYIDSNIHFQVDGKTKVNTFIQNSEKVFVKDISSNNHIKNGVGDFDLLVRSMHEDLVNYNEALPEEIPTDEATFNFKTLPNFFVVENHLIHRGLEFLRPQVADKNLNTEIIKAINNKTKPDELIKMAENSNTDILVKNIIASRLDLPVKAQEILLNTNIESIVHSLARNPSTQANFLIKISRQSAKAAAYVIENPSCPPFVLNELIKHKNPVFRSVLTFHKNLDSSLIAKLANDEDINIRIQLFILYSGYEFSNEIIETNLKEKNSELYKALIERNPNLTLQHYQTLLANEDVDVRMATLKNIYNPSMFLAHKKTTVQEREKLLYEFAKKTKEIEIKLMLVSLLPSKYHEEFVKKMTENDKEKFQMQLAANSYDKSIILNLLKDKKTIYYKNLASNYYLPAEVEKKLLQQIPSLSEVNASKDPEQKFANEFTILVNLLSNPQTNESTKTKIIEFCAALTTAARFCRISTELFGLSENQIKLLLQSKDKTLADNLITNLEIQVYAPESAIKLSRINNELAQIEFEKIKLLSGDEFWNGLAKAQSSLVKRIAAINHNIPVETLLELRKSKNLKLAYLTLLNPKYPLHLLKNESVYVTNQLSNPYYNKAIILEILNKTSVGTAPVIRDEMRTWLWLNDKKLKAKSLY